MWPLLFQRDAEDLCEECAARKREGVSGRFEAEHFVLEDHWAARFARASVLPSSANFANWSGAVAHCNDVASLRRWAAQHARPVGSACWSHVVKRFVDREVVVQAAQRRWVRWLVITSWPCASSGVRRLTCRSRAGCTPGRTCARRAGGPWRPPSLTWPCVAS